MYTHLQAQSAPIPQLPKFMEELTQTVVNQLSVDAGLALATLTSAMATAVHGTRSVRHPCGGVEPLSLISIVIAAPTTGKTRTYRLTHRVHLDEDVRRYRAFLSSKESGSAASPQANRPHNRERTRWVSLQDVTKHALVEAIEGIGESTSIASDEGQTVLNSDLFRRHLDTVNTLYDGNKVTLGRARGNSVMAVDASLVSLIMVQPDIFKAYCRNHEENARGGGFFARALFTIVPANRPSVGQSAEVYGSGDQLAYYESIVGRLLRDQLELSGDEARVREVMELSPEALDRYHILSTEHDQRTRSCYSHMQDAANRALQNVIRLAAIMHVFSGDAGQISQQSLSSAYEIVRWHLDQFSVLFPPKPWSLPPPPKLTIEERARQRVAQRVWDDRQAILRIIAELCATQRVASVRKSDVQTLFREQGYDARFRAALLRLMNEGRVLEIPAGKHTQLSIIPEQQMQPPSPIWPSVGSGL